MIIGGQEVIKFNGELYTIVRKYREAYLKEGRIDEFKALLNCDVALRKDGYIHFCKRVEEAEVVEN